MSERILTIADDALEMIVQLRDQEPGDDEYGLSVEITGINGAQFTYELAFVPVSDRSEGWVTERHDDLAVMFQTDDTEKLSGASLALTPQGLSMSNPNTPATPAMAAPKGDLEGPLADQVAQVLAEQVNPAIAAHGGAAELVSVDDERIAYLRLMGGCQGCGMAQMTLSEGIERIMHESIPELAGIVDVTNHEAGDNPYYEASKK